MLLRTPADRGGQAIVVGEAGFHGPPGDDGRVELGYMVVAGRRRRGYAEEAIRELMSWAAADHRVARFRVTVSPDNAPSLNLIRKLGFVRVDIQHREGHGEELIFHRDTETEQPSCP